MKGPPSMSWGGTAASGRRPSWGYEACDEERDENSHGDGEAELLEVLSGHATMNETGARSRQWSE